MVTIQVTSQIVTVAHTSPRLAGGLGPYIPGILPIMHLPEGRHVTVFHGVWSYESAAVSTAGLVQHACALTTGRCHP